MCEIKILFDIGANRYGEAVFKNPQKTFKTLKKMEKAMGLGRKR